MHKELQSVSLAHEAPVTHGAQTIVCASREEAARFVAKRNGRIVRVRIVEGRCLVTYVAKLRGFRMRDQFFNRRTHAIAKSRCPVKIEIEND